jgi:hypothetical protein
MASKRQKSKKLFCTACGQQFIGNHAISYKGCHSERNRRILLTGGIKGVVINYQHKWLTFVAKNSK